MLNKDLYERLEKEFARYKIQDTVEDVLLELSEALLDQGILGRKVTCRETYGCADLEASGVCEEDESVYLESCTIEGKIFEIGDYMIF